MVGIATACLPDDPTVDPPREEVQSGCLRCPCVSPDFAIASAG